MLARRTRGTGMFMLMNRLPVLGLPPCKTLQFRLKLLILVRPACDITLVSGRTGAIDRDAVCGLLIVCLQDVSSIAFTLHLVVVCYLASNFQLFLQ
jgi:hypothetical protein